MLGVRSVLPAVLAGAEEAALWCSGGGPSSPAQRGGACSQQAARQGGSGVVRSCKGVQPPRERAAAVEGNG